MNLADPFQRFQDWVTQQWVIVTGRKIDLRDFPWLAGPFGEPGNVGQTFFHQLAKREGLEVQRNQKSHGILLSMKDLNLSETDEERLSDSVKDFYEHTPSYQLDFSVEWNARFKLFGYFIRRLFSSRINQLNIPQTSEGEDSEIASEIIDLVCPKTGKIVYTVWYRTNRATGEVIYSGVYTCCQLPSGETAIKAIFPLPKGNATVILRPTVGKDGSLVLDASGEKFGEAGFYFLLSDVKKKCWSRYVKSFRDTLKVSSTKNGLIAKQQLTLWNRKVLTFHYEMRRE